MIQKTILFTLLCCVHFFSVAQHIAFEKTTTQGTDYGQIDLGNLQTNILKQNIDINSTLSKSQGWELVGLDGTRYYYQNTLASSNTYGQIKYYDTVTAELHDVSVNLSDIFDNPTHWTLVDVDQGLMYFKSSDANSQIVSYDGNQTAHFAYLKDFLGVPQYWTAKAVYNGVLYVQWTFNDSFSSSIKTWDGSRQSSYDITTFYNNLKDADIIGVSQVPISDNDFIEALNDLESHIQGNKSLSNAALNNLGNIFEQDLEILKTNTTVIAQTLALIKLYETTNPPLFSSQSTTKGGFSRSSNNYPLENLIFTLQQGILDYSYRQTNLQANPNLFQDYKFETSSVFPGAVAPSINPNFEHKVKINANNEKKWGSHANYETEDARRPTGCYLPPGSLATVILPDELVGIGASVLVGAHTWDLKNKSKIRRLDRVTEKYAINSNNVLIANPLGGSVYINIPYKVNLGVIEVSLKNVVRSPYYANTVANQTTVSDWKTVQRNYQAPWTDFETDKVMFQVPTSWVNQLDDPKSLMEDWDKSMDAVSDLMGRPHVRSKTVVYAQVDVITRGNAFYPGYPQSNVVYDPLQSYNGNHDNYLVQGPKKYFKNKTIATFFHELGHAEKIYKFRGEIEAFVNFLYVAVYNKAYGKDLDECMTTSFYGHYNHDSTIDGSAIQWMITENFRNGAQMSRTNGNYQNEFSYQARGYAKYADIVRLFGWEAIENFYKDITQNIEDGTYTYTGNVNFVPADDHILRMSKVTGYDMRPLIHFWGIHPDNPSELAENIEASQLKLSSRIYDQLQAYKTIIPKDNEAFQSIGIRDFGLSKIQSSPSSISGKTYKSYGAPFFKSYWNIYNEESAQKTQEELQAIIDLYFPNGRPQDDVLSIAHIDMDISSNQLVIYPIPATDKVTIESDKSIVNQVVVYDMKGMKVLHKTNSSLTNTFTLETFMLDSGVYFIKIFLEDASVSYKQLIIS